MEKAVYQLTQMLNRDKSNDTCNNCGESGHWAAECPKRSRFQSRGRDSGRGGRSHGRSGGGRGDGSRGGGRFGRGGGGRGGGRGGRESYSTMTSRRPPGRTGPFPPPREGESEIKMSAGKKYYFCKKCNRSNLSHSTNTHKSKEELSQTTCAQAGMAKVSFDLHPAAYKAIVRTTPAPVIVPKSSLNLSTIGLFSVMSILMNWVMLNWRFVALTSMHNFVLLWEMIQSNLLIVTLSILSCAISGITTYLVSTRVVPKEQRIRYRSGENIRKQWHRHRRRNEPGRPRHTRPYTGEEVVRDMAHAFAPHPRYHHVPCPWRHHAPDQVMIRQLRSNIARSHAECLSWQNALDFELRALRHQNEQVNAEEAYWTPRTGSSNRVPPSEGVRNSEGASQRQRKKVKNKLRANKSRANISTCRHTDVTDFYHQIPTDIPFDYGSFADSRPMPNCAMAEMVNLSNISSTNIGNGAKALPVLFDSGANCCITHRRDDFVGEYTKLTHGPIVNGIGKGLKIVGQGNVAWTFKDEDNMYRTLKLPCYYVPSSQTRIASIGQIMKAYPDESIHFQGQEFVMSGNKADNRGCIRIKFCATTFLPLGYTSPHKVNPQVHKAKSDKQDHLKILPGSASLTEGVNFNLAEPEKEILKWHYRLGHVGMRRIQWLFRQNVLNTSERTRRLQLAASKLSCGPLCTACQYSKQRRKTSPGSMKRNDTTNFGALKKDKMFPGQQVSVDHFFSSSKGRLIHTYGKEAESQKYMGGCIFVDHSSGLIHGKLQTHLNSHVTLGSKKEFETMCSTYGVMVQEYLSDNGTAFRNEEFAKHLGEFHQTMKHAAVGAHHGNGIAERNIGYVLSISRAMLHHAALHWPDVADVEL
jgi:hypothetical protein